MSWWSEIVTRVRTFVNRREMEQELDAEMAYHLEREAAKLIDQGWDSADARREARRRFGGVERHRENTRDAWGLRWLDDGVRDLLVSLRRMRRSPGFSLIAVLTLALGVGGTVALSSVVHGLLLRPLPYAEADELRTFWSEYNWRGSEFDHLHPRTEVFESLAAWSLDTNTMIGEGGSIVIPTGVASDELFDVLGAFARLGSTFPTDADRPGSERVIILSHGLWQREFGGDPDVVGRRVDLGEPTTVIGVMPPEFYFPTPEVQAWVPLDLDPATSAYAGNGWLNLVGRLRPGVSEADVDAELEMLTAALGERFTYPENWDKAKGASVQPIRTYLMGDIRPVLLLLNGAVALMLLMAVANLAALLLARTADRRQDFSIRAALGAGRGRLVRQIVTESMLLGGMAGLGGVVLAWFGFDALVAALPLRGGFDSTLRLEWGMLAGAIGVAALLGCVTALAPAHRLLSVRRFASLRPGARSQAASGGRGGVQAALVAAEVCVAVLLVTGATLFTRSAERLYDIDTGLAIEGVGAVDLLVSNAIEPDERPMLWSRLVQRVERVPGVASAGLTRRLPIRDGGGQGPVLVEDRPELNGTLRPGAYWRPVTLNTFETLGVDLVAGRTFHAGDREGAIGVVIVNEKLVADIWGVPPVQAIGRRIQPSFGSGWVTVVGVVEDVAITGVREEQTALVTYRPVAQIEEGSGFSLVFAAEGGQDRNARALLGPIRAVIQEIEPRVALSRPTIMTDVLDASISETLQVRFFFGVLGIVSLLIGAAGVYGVVAHTVGARSAEYGVRMALGAGRSRVVGDALAGQMRPVAIGVGVGLVLTVVAAPLVAGLVWEVAPTDPASLAMGALALIVVGALAAVVPVLRATSRGPSVALREG